MEKNSPLFDPADWGSFEEFGHRVVGDMVEYLKDLDDRYTWQPVPEKVRSALKSPIPQEPQGLEESYIEFKENILPYPFGAHHPRFWGWANGAGTPEGLYSLLMQAAFHSPCITQQHSGMWVELQVLNWFKEIFQFPHSAKGIFTGSGSSANLHGLAVARFIKVGQEIRKKGFCGEKAGSYTVYGSSETHFSVPKALDILGFGQNSFRVIPVKSDYKIDTDFLAEQIIKDRRDGLIPIAIVATAGTINTGAIDPLDRLSQIAQRGHLWLHVDGAFGAIPMFSEKYKHLLKGIEKADSLCIDLHKWLSQTNVAGCLLVKQGLQETFEYQAPYIQKIPGSLTDTPVSFSNQGLDMSQSFRAFPIWFSLKTHGVKKFGELVEQNIADALYLEVLVKKSKDLELLAPVDLNVVNFRFSVLDMSDDRLNALNSEILTTIQRKGIAAPNSTVINGRFSIRVCNINHRTKKSDFDLLVREVEKIGNKLLEKNNET